MIHEILRAEGYSYVVEIEGRGLCGIMRQLFTVGLFYGLDLYSYGGRYCYPTLADAVEGLLNWDGQGDPPGNWIKHKGKFEYSNPNKEN